MHTRSKHPRIALGLLIYVIMHSDVHALFSQLCGEEDRPQISLSEWCGHNLHAGFSGPDAICRLNGLTSAHQRNQRQERLGCSSGPTTKAAHRRSFQQSFLLLP